MSAEIIPGTENRKYFDLKLFHNKAKNILDQNRIESNDFVSLYGEKKIKDDEEYVALRKARSEYSSDWRKEEQKKMAEVFEAILFVHTELSEWLGEDVVTMVASEYDDWVNGIDMIAEFPEEGKSPSHLGLGIDATYGHQLDSKLKHIKESIQKNKLGTIKYFKSDNMDFMGQLSQVPKVIVAIERRTIIELTELWEKGKGSKKEMGRHWVQFQILEEIMEQLKVYLAYSQKIGNEKIAKKYELTLQLIIKIYGERKKKVADDGTRDHMFKEFMMSLDAFERNPV